MSNIFRVFVSSTFSDMVAERNALQKIVFPRLRDWCRKQGVTFQAIDLRWGISQEAGLNQRATDVCLNEIHRCQTSTKRPNFLLLMGDRYGWRPLPDDIPASEWDEFFPHITNAKDQNLLNRWYKRNDNAVPPLYVLQKRIGDFVGYLRWAEVENRLQTILWDAIRGLNWDDRTRMKYETSVTEQEIQAGIFDYAHADEGAICFFRTIHDLPDDAEKYRDMKDGVPDTHAQVRLTALKNRIRAYIPHNVHEYEAIWRGDKPDMDLTAFCEHVYTMLQQAIEAEIATQQSLTSQQIEQNAHDAFRNERGWLVIGRDDVLNRVGNYLHSDSQTPLVLYGQSGVGKSSIMARAIPDDALYRFIGVTPQSSDIRQVVYGLCEHIATRYGISETIHQDYEELIEAFPTFLAFATADKPLVIFLDALDQLSNTNVPYNLRWLPNPLPAHVKLVLSVIPSPYLTALQRQLPADALIEILPLAQHDADILLDKWLAEVNRTVQPHQRHEVMTKFAHTGLPLYLKLAFEEAKLWRSYDPITPLQDDVPSLIRHNLFGRLSDNAEHGELLVNRSMAYLRTSRNGLTEDEILDLLRADKAYWDDFYAKSFHQDALKIIDSVPIVIWSRLYFDLAPYMTQRSADGTALWAFFHRQFNEVVDATYLSEDVRQDRHAHLARYFIGQELYAGDNPNARKVSEQAYQQAMAGMKDEYVTTLTTYKFLQASLDVNGVLALIDDYGLMDDDSVQLIQLALSMSFHVLDKYPYLLPQQIEGRLKHYRKNNATILALLSQIDSDNKKGFFCIDNSYDNLTPVGGMLIKKLSGHSLKVKGVLQISSESFLTWSADSKLILWDILGNPQYVFIGHTEPVKGAIILSDETLLSWSEDACLIRWNQFGNYLSKFEGHSDWIYGAIEIDNMQIVSWCGEKDIDRTLRLWNKTGALEKILARDVIDVFQFYNRYFVSCSLFHELVLWNSMGNYIKSLVGHTQSVFGAIMLKNQEYVLTWSKDQTLRLWNIDENINSHIVFEGHTSGIKGAIELTDGRILSWGFNEELRLWHPNGQPCGELRGHTSTINGAIELTDGRILSWGFNEELRLWHPNGQPCGELRGHTSTINGAIELEDGRILSWSDDATLYLWKEHLKLCLDGHTDKVTDVILLNKNKIVSWCAGNTMSDYIPHFWDISRDFIAVTKAHRGYVIGILKLSNGCFLSYSIDKTLMLWNENGKLITVMEGHIAELYGTLEISNKRILSWSDDDIKIWDFYGTNLYTFSMEKHSIEGAMELSDGRILMWGSAKSFQILSQKLEPIFRLSGHTAHINGAIELVDGRILSWGGDKTLRLWDNNGNLIHTMTRHIQSVDNAVQLPDERIISWGLDELVCLWDRDGVLIETIREDNSLDNDYKVFAIQYMGQQGIDISHLLTKSKQQIREENIYLYDNDFPIFSGDNQLISSALSLDEKTLIVGDYIGRVIFLRWVGEDGR